MRRVTAIISTLFACGIVGALYGVVLGAIYAGLYGISEAHGATVNESPVMILSEVILSYGAIGALIGFPAGFISGVIGGSLGGPFGYSIGGFIGTGATVLPLIGGADGLRSPMLFSICPSILGAAVGLVLGLHLRRRVPVLPGAKWLAGSIYSSPLGGWLGWRQG
jgi:hypothetical protein